MARRWQTISVQLVSGRGMDLEHPAGRVLICPTGTTFWQLALAIDRAFARWDLAHERMFELADGTTVAADDFAEELEANPIGAISRTASIGERVKQHVGVGDRFTYVFDLGDDWRHECTVTGLHDPDDELGFAPDEPVPIWGWGTIPDQYGRRWSGDDGESEPPTRTPTSQDKPATRPLDARAWMTTVRQGSIERMRDLLAGADPDAVLQQVGAPLLSVLRKDRAAAKPLEPIALSVLQRLRMRGQVGDALLADDLLAALRDEPVAGTALEVDLQSVADEAASYGEAPGCYLNVRTGESVIGVVAHSDALDEAERIDVEGVDWIHLELEGPARRDMAAFAERQGGRDRERLERAIEGTKAFSRFRDAVGQTDLWGEWQSFADELRWGELRELLREHGIVPV